MQQILARAGRGIEREVEQLRAVQEAGLTAMFYCATRTQARLAADAGIDLVCLNLGWNVGGALGHHSHASLEEVATAAREIGRLIKRINPKTRFLLEGGPIATAEDLGRILALAPIDGYVGGSTFERLPLEDSVADQIGRFRRASRGRTVLDSESARLVAWGRPFGFVGRSKAQLDFLRRLRTLAAAPAPVLLLAERGLDPLPALKALGGGAAKGRAGAAARSVLHLDLAAEEVAARARGLLFGQRESLERRPPALADTTLGQLVLFAPERLPAAIQRRLAHALRDGLVRAPGSRRSLQVAPRLVLVCDRPASGRRLEERLLAAGLEAELVAQLAGFTLRLPPLRERIDDLPAVIGALSAASLGSAMDRSDLSPAALRALNAHLWPGNEAELRALLGALAGRGGREPVQPAELQPLLQPALEADSEGRSERDRILDALWRHGFNRTRTAEALGMSRKTLYNKIQRFGLAG